MKGIYLKPELKIVSMEAQDIVAASMVGDFNTSWLSGSGNLGGGEQ